MSLPTIPCLGTAPGMRACFDVDKKGFQMNEFARSVEMSARRVIKSYNERPFIHRGQVMVFNPAELAGSNILITRPSGPVAHMAPDLLKQALQ